MERKKELENKYNYLSKNINLDDIGSCYKRKRDKWELCVSLGFDEKGKRIRKYRQVYAMNENEARDALKVFVSENKDELIVIRVLQRLKTEIRSELYDFCSECKENCPVKNKIISRKYRINKDCKAFQFYIYKLKNLEKEYEYIKNKLNE